MISARPGAPPRSIDREIFLAADIAAKHFVAVDEHDERMPRFEGPRVEADAEVGEREAIFAVGRERVREPQAAAGAERHAVDVGRLVAGRRREVRGRDFRHGLADREMRDRARAR